MKTTPLLFAALLLPCCAATDASSDAPAAAYDNAAYVAEIDEWHAGRIGRLRSHTGWLTVVGLHPLQAGSQTVGSAPDADVKLVPSAPPRIGVITIDDTTDGKRITFTADESVEVEVFESDPPQRVETIEMATDATDHRTVLAAGPILMHVIDRAGDLSLRVRDQDNAALHEFRGIDRYPVDPRYRVTAEVLPDFTPVTLHLTTGQVINEPSPGILSFELDGVRHELKPSLESDGSFFLVFADATTGHETYTGGRFLSIDPPDEDGRVMVDFNRAYNPPCVFSAYATCPRPPMENHLAVPIRAGEKDASHD